MLKEGNIYKKIFILVVVLMFFNKLLFAQGNNYKIFGFVQSRVYYSDTSPKLNFQINKARFGLNAKATDKLGLFAIMEMGKVSPTGSYSASLLDAYVWYDYSDFFRIRLGRDWYKFGWEYTQPIPTLPFINFAESMAYILDTMGRNGFYGYDTGLWIFGVGKILNFPVGYNFSLTNGSGLNMEEDNDFKDVTLRVYFRPLGKIHFGASYFKGYSLVEKDNLGEYIYDFEFRYLGEIITIGSEYIYSRYMGSSEITKVEKSGYYLYVDYKILNNINLLARYEDTNSLYNINENVKFYTIGVTYTIKKLNNIKVNYVMNDNDLPDYLIVQFQSFFE